MAEYILTQTCSLCLVREGIWQCTECFGKPEFCMSCCSNAHQRLSFHRVKQCMGTHFESS
ncbi:hypothetical protein SERLA73DRAFT_44555 [Serpula lacrymans var. lacrymans S7.3]|uniref:Uncharacterized protein n=1 Tax=Serpula lacrymans var. lacrymans (strain S7.3) TaxID=936435 RepID=F8PFT2_SERL3|nr:hypothetical protein SERLA73DRAFT_44555 [Serpula lacrymans var. lacrymans S7.3]